MRIAAIFIILLAAMAITPVPAKLCPAGTFYWVRNGIDYCQQCQPGCACPGNYTQCLGCSAGTYSAAPGAASCTACPPGTTTDAIFNAGCEPDNIMTPCANQWGPLGFTKCYTPPPPATTAFTAPSGALTVPPQYLTPTPPYVPNVLPPSHDMDDKPFLQQSY